MGDEEVLVGAVEHDYLDAGVGFEPVHFAAQARQDELAAMDGARRDVMQSYPQGDLGDQWPGEPEPNYVDDEDWPHEEPLAGED